MLRHIRIIHRIIHLCFPVRNIGLGSRLPRVVGGSMVFPMTKEERLMTLKDKKDKRRQRGLCTRCGKINDSPVEMCKACAEWESKRLSIVEALASMSGAIK